MSWVTIVWSMIAAAGLTLAAIHFVVWYRRRRSTGDLLFSLTSAALAIYAWSELSMMLAETPAQFATALRWLHVPAWVIIVSLVGFVRLRLQAGRPWLGWAVCATRTLSLLLNFLVGDNLNYREVTALQHVPFLGEMVSVGVGVPNPWMVTGQLSLGLWLVFMVDATITVWQRGDQRVALVTVGSIAFFTLAAIAQAVLVLWQIVDWPLTVSPAYLGIVLAMGYNMGSEVLRAEKLADDLRESNTRMSLTAEATGIGVWIRDLERNEIWASDRWRTVFGFSSSESLDLNRILARLHTEDRERFRETLAQVITGDGSYDREFRVVLPDGQLRWIASRGRVEFDGHGKPVVARGISLDITARKEAEAELYERRNELAHLSRVTMVGELSASLTHELNQPLTSILTHAQAAQRYLAMDPPDLAEIREILANIVSDDRRAGEVIRRLRLLLEKGEIQRQPLDVNEVILEVLKLMHGELVNLGVAVEKDLAPDLARVRGDRVQLQQVLLNLVMNATDAMRENEAKDRLLTLRTRPDDGGIRIEVSDVGCGLPNGGAKQAFERFFTTKRHGLGLGLSVCRTIIAAHGGTLDAEDNAGRGATFYCVLPLPNEPPI